MAEPKTEIEQRLDRIERAVSVLAQRLVEAQTGFGIHDYKEIEKILRRKKWKEQEESKEDAS